MFFSLLMINELDTQQRFGLRASEQHFTWRCHCVCFSGSRNQHESIWPQKEDSSEIYAWICVSEEPRQTNELVSVFNYNCEDFRLCKPSRLRRFCSRSTWKVSQCLCLRQCQLLSPPGAQSRPATSSTRLLCAVSVGRCRSRRGPGCTGAP